jgi:hypothetical protein
MLCRWDFWTTDRSGKSSCSQHFIKAPWEGFSLKSFFNWVAYQEIKIKDGIDMEI